MYNGGNNWFVIGRGCIVFKCIKVGGYNLFNGVVRFLILIFEISKNGWF